LKGLDLITQEDYNPHNSYVRYFTKMSVETNESEKSILPVSSLEAETLPERQNGHVKREKDSTDAKKRAKRLPEDEDLYLLGDRSPSDDIAPDGLKIEQNKLILDGTRHVQTLAIWDHPTQETVGTYEDIYSQPNVTTVLHISPVANERAIDDLTSKQRKLKNVLDEIRANNLVPDSNTQDAYKQVSDLNTAIKRGQERVFHVANYVRVEALGDSALEAAVSKLKLMLKTAGQKIVTPTRRQIEGFNSTGLMVEDELKIGRTMNTRFLAAKLPWSRQRIIMENGIILGETMGDHQSPVMVDLWDTSFNNGNGMVVGTGGVGKTTALIVWGLRHVAHGKQVLVIDPAQESKDGFRLACDVAQGNYVKFGPNTINRINILDMPPYNPNDENSLNPYLEQMEMVPEILRYMIQDTMDGKNLTKPFSRDESVVLKKALRNLYSRYGIYESEPENYATQPMPVLQELLRDLRELASGRDDELAYHSDLSEDYQKIADSQYNRLKASLEDVTGRMFTGHTNIDMDANMVVFSMSGLAEPQIPMGYLISNRLLWNTVRTTKRERLAITDEAQVTLGDSQEQSGKEMQRKTMATLSEDGRKHDLGVLIATQRYGNLTSTETGKKLANNSNLKFYMGQEELGMSELPHEFSDEELKVLASGPNSRGKGVMMLGMGKRGNNRVMMDVKITRLERKITATSSRQEMEDEEVEQSEAEWEQDQEAIEVLKASDSYYPAID
jgi:hypothetical protein